MVYVASLHGARLLFLSCNYEGATASYGLKPIHILENTFFGSSPIDITLCAWLRMGPYLKKGCWLRWAPPGVLARLEVYVGLPSSVPQSSQRQARKENMPQKVRYSLALCAALFYMALFNPNFRKCTHCHEKNWLHPVEN